MSKLTLALVVIYILNGSLSAVTINNNNRIAFSARQVGQSMAECFGEAEIFNCFKNKLTETIDKAIANNETWQWSDFIVIERNTSPTAHNFTFEKLQNLSKEVGQQNSLTVKLLQLAQIRSFKFQLPTFWLKKLFNKRSFTLEDFTANEAGEQQFEQEEGRKKKHKHKNVAMIGGMAILALIAQMFLGKVILIAGTAFIMAKIALLISALGSLKSRTGGSVGTSDHVIVTGGAGETWNRRTPQTHKQLEILNSDEHKFTEPINYYEVSKADKFKRRNQYQIPTTKNNVNKINLWKNLK